MNLCKYKKKTKKKRWTNVSLYQSFFFASNQTLSSSQKTKQKKTYKMDSQHPMLETTETTKRKAT